MTIYRSLLRLVLFLLMAGGPMVWAPWAQAHVAPHAPTKAVTLSVVASSRKGLGGRYVYSPWVFNIANMTLGPHGGIYFDGWSGPIIHITPDHKVLVVARPQSEGWHGNHELFGTFSSLAVLPNGDLYALYNSVLFRISPKGQLIFVPLRSPTGQLLPNPNAPPYPYPARYPSLEYLATGPRGRVYVSDGLSVWRVGQHNTLHLVPAHMRCSIPISAYTQDIVRGAHGHLYATGPNTLSNGMLPPRSEQVTGVYRTSRISPDCVSPRGPWTTIFLGKGFDLQGPIARGPHGHLYVASKRTIYRMRFHSKADGK